MNHWLYAIVMRLVSLRPGAVPADHGDLTRSALLNLIEAGNPILSAELHDTNTHKPYTISLLDGGSCGKDGALHFGAGSEAFWRFTLLREPAFDAVLRRYLLSRAQPHVRIGALEFAITDAYAAAGRHLGSGSIAIADLNERWSGSPDQFSDQITLRFLSATTFSLGQCDGEYRWHLMPDSRMVFGTLRKRWLQLGGIAPGDEFDVWVQQHVLINSIEITTHQTRIKKRPVPGFSGTVSYRISGDNRWWGLVHLLADLAFWTGIGYQTPCGMGQIRRINQNEVV